MRKKISVLGRKFGRLLVISEAGSTENRECLWRCRCDCGNFKDIRGSVLRDGRSKSCGCLNREKTSKRAVLRNKQRILPDAGAARNRVEAFYKRNAKLRGLEWGLSRERFIELTSGICVYCGAAPSKRVATKGGEYIYNGIDRINNALGYIRENVVSCCRRCNVAKAESTVEEFRAWIVKAYQRIT